MRRSRFIHVASRALCALALVACQRAQAAPTQPAESQPSPQPTEANAAPTDRDLLRIGEFALPLVPLGATSASENRALLDAVHRYLATARASGERDRVEALLDFLRDHPQSVWKPALLVNLGSIQRQTGHFSLALASWQEAWALSRAASDATGQAVGDAAVAHLSQLLAYLGRQEELAPLLASIRDRPLHGTAAELISESSRGLADMRTIPEHSFKCGPFALSRILQYRHAAPDAKQLAIVQAAKSTSKGLSLRAVAELAKRAGMQYQMAFRSPGAAVIAPAVAHWRVGHYAALVGREAGRYVVQDDTFGEDVRMTSAALDAEASGYFLIPAGPLPAGWRSVPAAEGGKVWGRGDTGNNKDNGATGPAESPAFSSGAGCAGGCTIWNVEPMVVSLALHDVPVGSVPPIGPTVRFDVYYSQRDVQQPQLFNYANLGRKWTTSWLSYVTSNLDLNGSVELYRRGGGNETFRFEADAKISVAGPFSQSTITREVDPAGTTLGFIRKANDGSSEEFRWAFGNKFFMTAVVDPYGNAAKIEYDTQNRIVSLTDALGNQTRLVYEDSDPLKITGVTDPYGRSAKFTYTASGYLETVTDTLGITSKYSYGSNDFITTLETPYGTTSFEYGDSTTDPELGNTRFINVTDKLGRTSRVEFRHSAPGISMSHAIDEVPAGLGIANDFMQWRNTFIWNAVQYAQAQRDGQLDYTKARLMHWLHTNDNSTSRVLESIKEPLENRVWFTYPGQTDPTHVGTSSTPLRVGRVVGEGKTQLMSFEYNEYGKVSLMIDPFGRKYAYEYAANGIDLTAVSNVTGDKRERMVSMGYDALHRVVTVTPSHGRSSRNEYNARGQLTRQTDAFENTVSYAYDERALLIGIDASVTGQHYSFSYDASARLSSASDASGVVVRYEYDAADRPTRAHYADGSTTELNYRWLDLVSIKDRVGRTTAFSFDAERNLIQVVDALGKAAKLSYGADNALASTTDPDGNLSRVERDLQGRILSKFAPDGSAQRFGYERGSSRLRSVTDALEQTTLYDYEIDDSVSRISYEKANQVTGATSYRYDAAYARLVAMIDATGETQYTYHPSGALASVSSPVAGAKDVTDKVSFEYDAVGRVISQIVSGVAEHASYDAQGRVLSVSNPLDDFDLKYGDASARVQEISAHHGPKAVYEYFDVKHKHRLRELRVQSRTGKPLAGFGYSYDAYGSIQRFAESFRDAKLADLDASASATAEPPTSHPAVPGTSRSASFAAALRPNPAWFASVAVLLLMAALALRRRSAPLLALLLTPVLATSSCSEVKFTPSLAVVRSTDYAYDGVGRVVSASIATDPSDTTSAKPSTQALSRGQVSSVSAALKGPDMYTYEYDARSNLVAMSSPGDGGSASSGYDASNRVAGTVYNAVGSPQQVEDARHEWDAENRVIRIVRGTHESLFAYDGLHRLVRIIEKIADKISADHAYVWCGAERCLERDNLREGSPVSKRYFRQGFVADGHKFYYVKDRHGSVRQLLDDTGQIRAQYDYDPYGKSTRTRGDVESDFGYAGYFQHGPSQLAFSLFRAYDAGHARWLSPDPLGEAGGLNLYAYAGGNPVNSVDPLGLWAGVDDAIAIGAGAIVGVAVQGGVDLVTGKVSSWQDYAAAAIGGAAGGEAALYMGPVGAGAASGAASNLARQGLNWASGKQCGFSFTSLAIETGAGAVGGAVASKVGQVIRGAAPAIENEASGLARACSGGKCMCFAPGTQVLMADGSTKAIETIAVGDAVLSDDPTDDAAPAPRSVLELHRTATYRLFEIRFGAAEGGVIEATARHPFWTQRGWVPAENLTTQDQLLRPEGQFVAIESIGVESRDTPTYNLTVDQAHTYFVVAGQTPVLVHNVDPWDILFTQDSYGPTFTDGPWAGRTIEEAAEAARGLGRLPDGLTLNAVRMGDGSWATLNNRTLAVARLANLPNVNPVEAGASGMNKMNQLLRNSGLAGPIEEAVMRCK